MSDPNLPTRHGQIVPPPPAPPLPPSRLGPLQRIIAPLGLNIGQRQSTTFVNRHGDSLATSSATYTSRATVSQYAVHKTGLPIAAVDINSQQTHAILAGKEILKTVRIQDGKVTEDYNLRSTINSYFATHVAEQADNVSRRRDWLPARDVKWSRGVFDHIVATAANNGRISLYDVKASGARIELARLHEHTGQVNRLDFDPFAGYLLLSGSQDRTVRLWDIREPRTAHCRQKYEVRTGVRDVRWSPAESLEFAVCGDGGVIQKWDARYPLAPKLSIHGHEKACYSLDWHPDGSHVVSGGFDKLVKVWDFKSENKRQKPLFHLKAPQAIRNVRWRPAVVSNDTWKSTQIATSYYQDDPRIHIWDWRRTHLPFRELDNYNHPATDLLWASKDLLWTVGDEGNFTQTDITFTSQTQNSLPPGAVDWLPDGSFASFSEDRDFYLPASRLEPKLGFLSLPPERLSGENEGAISRSLTDEDEAELDGYRAMSSKRRETRASSTKSVKSQANTPPSVDGQHHVLPLDKAIKDHVAHFANNQIGTIGWIHGVAAEPNKVRFLAMNYARPSLDKERKKNPHLILQRLKGAFEQNAKTCDAVAMYRMAQSWRILSAVIVPELEQWANDNRLQRKVAAAKRRTKRGSSQSTNRPAAFTGFAKVSTLDAGSKPDTRGQKIMSNLFKGLNDSGSTSNMTTPMARPLLDSQLSSPPPMGGMLVGEPIDTFQSLPPSVLTSHNTAAIAAKALRRETTNLSDLTTSSEGTTAGSDFSRSIPGILEPTKSEQPIRTTQSVVPPLQKKHTDITELRHSSAHDAQKQEERRAAIRDYRAQARSVFKFDQAVEEADESLPESHDPADSFLMFSTSTESSFIGQSLENSIISPEKLFKSSSRRGQSNSRHGSEFSSSSSPKLARSGSPVQSRGQMVRTNDRYQSKDSNSQNEAETFRLSLDAKDTSQIMQKRSNDSYATSRVTGPVVTRLSFNPSTSAVSSSPEVFSFEGDKSPSAPRIHTCNPVHQLAQSSPTISQREKAIVAGDTLELTADELAKDEYIYSDFRPIDLSKYEPKIPFAWSALPLICHSIAFDLENGIAHAQFAAHLLMHVHAYFFHQDFRRIALPIRTVPEDIVDRLMRPDLSHRVVEGIFHEYHGFLEQVGLCSAMAEVKKMCLEFDYLSIAKQRSNQKEKTESITGGDEYYLFVSCNSCGGPLPSGSSSCLRCKTSRGVCPLCLSLNRPDVPTSSATSVQLTSRIMNQNIWTACQACGHGGHLSCLEEWLTDPSSEGTCPTAGCGCDCSPGICRQTRIRRQLQAEEESKLIASLNHGPHHPSFHSATGPSPSNHAQSTGAALTRKDPNRATPSPAVDKTRAVLRSSVASERGTQSGDERGLSSYQQRNLPGTTSTATGTGSNIHGGIGGSSRTGGTSMSRGNGFFGTDRTERSLRKSVRVIMPGEEQKK